MARVTYVKKAQQRYATKPVLDAEGNPLVIPVTRKDGTPKTTKSGRVITRKVTESDKTKPLPLRKCEACGQEIAIGQPYKHVTPKSGPYGGYTRFRCGTCPGWQPWDLSNALWARIAQIQAEFSDSASNAQSRDDLQAVLEDAASAARELADEKRESASNIEDGFGHATYQSDELNEQADAIESWADEMENADIPEAKCEECNGSQEVDCDQCGGTGQDDCQACEGTGEESDAGGVTLDNSQCEICDGRGQADCGECEGTGTTDCTNCDGDEEFFDLEEALQAVQDIVDEGAGV